VDEDITTLKRITFDPTTFDGAGAAASGRSGMNAPPSWSWMAYHGGISFVEPPKGSVRWNDALHINFTGTETTSWLHATDNLWIRAPVFELVADASELFDKMEITYDIPEEAEQRVKKIVVIGTLGRQNDLVTQYVLVISPKGNPEAGIYERIGAGKMPNKFLKRDGIKQEVILIH